MRPPLRIADAIMSMPTAILLRSRLTASSIFRSSLTIRSTMSSGASLSISRLDGLIASVGSDCHFDRTAIDLNSKLVILRSDSRGLTPSSFHVPGTALIDAYLTHLTVAVSYTHLTL